MSTAKIVIANEGYKFTDDKIFDNPYTMKVSLGYSSTGLNQIGGLFYTLGPKFVFPVAGGGPPQIVIQGVSEDFQMGRTDKRRVWRNVSDSDVAEQIANEYGWFSDVETTTPIHDHMAQVNESDWKFLSTRAKRHGFQLYLDHDVNGSGVLHFHKPRFSENSNVPRMIYYYGNDSQLNGFTVQTDTLHWGSVVHTSQVDPLQKEVFELSSSDDDDEITKRSIAANKTDVVRWSDMSKFNGQRPDVYMYETGEAQNRSSLQSELQGWAEHLRWMVHGDGEVIGLEHLKPRDVVELLNIGRASGKYYITDVVHELKAGAYTTYFKVVRSWMGVAGGSIVENKAVEPVSSGNTVVLA